MGLREDTDIKESIEALFAVLVFWVALPLVAGLILIRLIGDCARLIYDKLKG